MCPAPGGSSPPRARQWRARRARSHAPPTLGKYGDINARHKAAEAAAYKARLNVVYCYVKAPFDGYVTNDREALHSNTRQCFLNIAAGKYANEGKQVVSLVDDRNWYVLANFRESFLARIQPGMHAEVFLLSYPKMRFRGRVESVGWALFQDNGSCVEGLPRVEPTLNSVRLAQRFPVRVTLEDRDPRYPFRMGGTAVVTIKGYP